MTGTDNTFTVGDELPRVRSVSVHDGLQVTVTWDSGARAARSETIDLAPAVLRYKVYAPLRGYPDLFRTVRVINGGYAIAWGEDDAIDMASTTLEELAEQTMASADFAAFVKRHGYTLDSVAAELGISRRQAAYYQSEKAVPRYIALACAYLDTTRDVKLTDKRGGMLISVSAGQRSEKVGDALSVLRDAVRKEDPALKALIAIEEALDLIKLGDTTAALRNL